MCKTTGPCHSPAPAGRCGRPAKTFPFCVMRCHSSSSPCVVSLAQLEVRKPIAPDPGNGMRNALKAAGSRTGSPFPTCRTGGFYSHPECQSAGSCRDCRESVPRSASRDVTVNGIRQRHVGPPTGRHSGRRVVAPGRSAVTQCAPVRPRANRRISFWLVRPRQSKWARFFSM